MNQEKIVTIRGRNYKLNAVYHQHSNTYAWEAYRATDWGGWAKIPSWTRAEINNFPKLVASAAHEYVCGLNKRLNPGIQMVCC